MDLELTLDARSNPDLWASCIGGALVEGELAELSAAAGLVDGRIVKSGGKELALELEERGYDWVKELSIDN